MTGAVNKANEILRDTEGACMPSPFKNPANSLSHEKTPAEEIWRATEGKLDASVTGVGTGGTLSAWRVF